MILNGGMLPEWYAKGGRKVQQVFDDKYCYSSCEDSYSDTQSSNGQVGTVEDDKVMQNKELSED